MPQKQDGTISWAGNMPVEMEVNVVFTATVDMDFGLYGETITNTVAVCHSLYAGNGSATAAFTVATAPDVTITKSVDVPELMNPGSVVTYTMSLSNTGEAAALDLAMTDTLPAGYHLRRVDRAKWCRRNRWCHHLGRRSVG